MALLPYVLVAVLAVFLLYTIVVPTALYLPRFMGRQHLFCPTHRAYADVQLNAAGAALTSAYATPSVHVRRCTLKPRGAFCDEHCLEESHL